MDEQNSAGGTLTANEARTALSDTHFRRLQELRRGFASSGNGDGYLAVMLVNRAGWTPEQTAQFLGLDSPSTNAWLQSFADRRDVAALSDLTAPLPAAI